MKMPKRIFVPLVAMLLFCSAIEITGEASVTIHIQTVGHEGRDVLTVTLDVVQERHDWLYLHVNPEMLDSVSTIINVDRLESTYFHIQGDTVAVYKGALTEVSKKEYIVYVLNDVPKVGWLLKDRIASTTGDTVKTIVMFKQTGHLRDLGQYGDIQYVFASGLGAVVVLPREKILPVSRKDYVLYVEDNAVVNALLSNAIPHIHADDVWSMGYDGTGITIGVLDTGLDPNHCDISGKIVAWNDLVNGNGTPYDDHGHGTFVASCAAGKTNPKGVAPGASLMGVKVLNSSGSGSNDTIIQGIDWAVANGADVINLSLGGAGGDGTSPVAQECNWAVSQGVIVVTSAGGSGPGCKTIGTPGDATDVITVGSVDYNNAIADFSSRGPTTDGRVKPDVVAPGVSISAADAGTSCSDVTMSGTSWSAALVSGVCALVLDRNASATPLQVKNILGYTALDLGNAGKDNYYGWGLVDAKDAVDNAFNNPTPPGKAQDPYCEESCLGTVMIGFFIVLGVLSKE
jgi:subtilisin family serine protease